MEQNDSFSMALADLADCAGHRWSRRGWNGPGQFIEVQVPDEHSKMTRPYLYITSPHGDRTPWVPSSGDLFAEDWYIVAG